ncbi:hypothetical protein ASG99_06625 [Bacillus sp. Soil768D1]|nr:hypothetical protein ASG99_06625 [Bacillus sp. Soil768D1]
MKAATKSRAEQYEKLKEQVVTLKKEFQGIVGLDHEFQGAGAAAIKSFHEAQIDVADAWINTVVEVPFLDGEVSNGINQAKSLVDEQASDLQMIMNSIDDILPLHMFDLKL